jgi:hypothetical protein
MAMMRPQQGQSMPGMGGSGSMEDMMRRHFPQQQPAPQQSTPGTPETPKQP